VEDRDQRGFHRETEALEVGGVFGFGIDTDGAAELLALGPDEGDHFLEGRNFVAVIVGRVGGSLSE